MTQNIALHVFLFLSTYTLLRFTVAIGHHFDSPVMPKGTPILAGGVFVSFIALAILSTMTQAFIFQRIVGAIGIYFSLRLFLQCLCDTRGRYLKAVLDQNLPNQIITDGIYSILRHPMYASYVVFWISFAFGSGNFWSIVPAAAMVALYLFLAIGEESTICASEHQEAYRKYSKKAGMFWPILILRS